MLAGRHLRSPPGQSQRAVQALLVLGKLCMVAAAGVAVAGHVQAGLDPQAQAWSATVGVLLGYLIFHAAVLVLMGVYVLARCWCGPLQPGARATLDNTVLMWQRVTVQALITLSVVQLLPAIV
jgi:cytochrome c oxidase subunit I+III